MCISNSITNGDYIFFTVASGGKLTLYVRRNGTAMTTLESVATVTTGEWHHVAWTWAADYTLKQYLDGTAATTSATYIPIDVDTMAFGRLIREVPAGYFNGNLSDAAFYDGYVLTAGDISNLYTNKYSPELVGTATASWRMDEPAAASNITDDVSGTYTMTSYNNPSVEAGPSGMVYSLGVDATEYYIYTDVIGGTEDGTSLVNAWPDMQKAITYFSTASQDPISLNESVTVYCIGATADANVPITGTIPTDATHPITFVGDMLSTTWNEDYYHIAGPNEMLWTIDSNYVTLQNLQMQLTSEDGAGDGCLTITTPHATANLVQVITSIFRGDNINDQDDIAVTSTDTGTNLYWYRNAIYDVNEGTDLLVNCKMSFTDSQPSGGGGSVFSGVVQ